MINTSFTDFSLIKLPPETDFFKEDPSRGSGDSLRVKPISARRTPEIALGHNTGYSYAHAHIEQIKNAR